MTGSAQAKKKGKKAAERELTKEAILGKRGKTGWKLVRGEAAGKLAVRMEDEDEVIFQYKVDAIAYIHSDGVFIKANKQDMDELTEGCSKTVEIWACKSSLLDYEPYYWFLERC